MIPHTSGVVKKLIQKLGSPENLRFVTKQDLRATGYIDFFWLLEFTVR
jgi:hypothetical protein